MKLLKTNFDVFVILSLLIVVTSVKRTGAKTYKRVVIHVPVKVKHHHHTHTVYKHIHHAVPIHYDHHDVHVVHPETTEDVDNDFYIPPGRGYESIMDDFNSYSDPDYDRSGEQDSYERYRKKRSRKKLKLFNNKVIGWKGRSDFDKIASEYLESIKKQRIPDKDYRELHSDYEDEESKKKR